jgi:hypothetical protein
MRSGLSRTVDCRCGHCELEVSCCKASESGLAATCKKSADYEGECSGRTPAGMCR